MISVRFFYQATGYHTTLMVYVTKHKYNKVSAAIYVTLFSWIDQKVIHSTYVTQVE